MVKEAELPIVERTVAEMWQDYAFLTREMFRFLEAQDMTLFMELLEQRERLQHELAGHSSQSFFKTDAGQALLTDIKAMDCDIMYQLQRQINQDRQQQKVANAYESGYNQLYNSSMNWQR